MIKRKERVQLLISMAWLSGLFITIPFVVIAALDKTTIIKSETRFLSDLNQTDAHILNEIIHTNQTHFFYVKNSCNFYNVYFSVISIMFSFWIPMVLMLSLTCITIIMLNKSKYKLKPYDKNKLNKPKHQIYASIPNPVESNVPTDPILLKDMNTKEPVPFSSQVLHDVKRVYESSDIVSRPTSVFLDQTENDMNEYIESSNRRGCLRSLLKINCRNKKPKKVPIIDQHCNSQNSSKHSHANKPTNLLCKETEAQRRSLIVLVAFILGYTPLFSLITVSWLTNIELDSNYFVYLTWLGYLSSALNPSLYAWMNRNLKQAFYMIITCKIGGKSMNTKKFHVDAMHIAVKRF
jgi:hypothetical protein